MTVSIVLSTQITAGENIATHQDRQDQGAILGASAVCEASAGIVIHGLLVFYKVPVDANIHSLKLGTDDLGTVGTLDIGFYPSTKLPENLVYGDAVGSGTATIASAIDVHTAAVAVTEYRYSVPNIDTTGKKAWELAGLTAKPSYSHFWVAAHAAAATDAAGTIVSTCSYIA